MSLLLVQYPMRGVRMEGFEPSFHGSGPRVLPLDDTLMVAAAGIEPASPAYETAPAAIPVYAAIDKISADKLLVMFTGSWLLYLQSTADGNACISRVP